MAEDSKKFREENDGTEEASRSRTKLKKNGYRRPSGRIFNAFDGVVIVLIAVVVALLLTGTRLFHIGDSEEQSYPCQITCTLIFSGVEETFAASIAKGDTAYSDSSGVALGMVSEAVETAPHQEAGYVAGAAVMKTIPGQVDMTVVLQCDGTYVRGEGCKLNGSPLRIGDFLGLRFPEYVGVAECVDISWELTATNQE